MVVPIVPGLLFGVTSPFDPTLTDEAWNDWYTNKHIVEVVNSGLASNGFRYKNKHPSASWPYLAIYHLLDLPKLYDPEVMAIQPTDSPKSWGEGNLIDVAKVELRGYRLLNVFEAESPREGAAKILVTEEVNSTESDQQKFVGLYQEQKTDKIKTMEGYRRSMIFKGAGLYASSESETANGPSFKTDFCPADEQRPKYLAVHELDQLPSKMELATLESHDVWEYIAEYGTGLYRINPKKGRVH